MEGGKEKRRVSPCCGFLLSQQCLSISQWQRHSLEEGSSSGGGLVLCVFHLSHCPELQGHGSCQDSHSKGMTTCGTEPAWTAQKEQASWRKGGASAPPLYLQTRGLVNNWSHSVTMLLQHPMAQPESTGNTSLGVPWGMCSTPSAPLVASSFR